jgi:Flagellar hook capping protein - N-terminal region
VKNASHQRIGSDHTARGQQLTVCSLSEQFCLPEQLEHFRNLITLLAAQLQAQDPLNPIDPTTFVTQLVQFNQLEQLININQALSGPTAATSSATQTSQSPVSALSARTAASRLS